MLKAEIRLFIDGREISFDSFVKNMVGEVLTSTPEKLSRCLSRPEKTGSQQPQKADIEMPRVAVSKREAARLLSISPRTVENYIASKDIRCVRVGRRVLIPMKSVNEVASRGIPRRRNEKPSSELGGRAQT